MIRARIASMTLDPAARHVLVAHLFAQGGEETRDCERDISVGGLATVGRDAFAAFACLWMAFTLRLGTIELPPQARWYHLLFTAAIVPPIFWAFGLYREITRYLGPRYAWLQIGRAHV